MRTYEVSYDSGYALGTTSGELGQEYGLFLATI